MTIEWYDWKEWWFDKARNGRMRPWLDPSLESKPSYRKANLGCGTIVFSPDRGWTNVDQFGDHDDVVECDLCEIPWPWNDNEFDYIFMSNILEHIPHHDNRYDGEFWFHIENELLRITKPNGIWEIHGPSPDNAVVELQRGGHCRLIGPVTFEHLVVCYHHGAMLLTKQHEKFRLRELDVHQWYGFGNGNGLTDWHARNYLGRRLGDIVSRILGHPCQIRMVYQVVK